jgi:hypothetical protein
MSTDVPPDPPPLKPWVTADVVALGRGMLARSEFSALAILADAAEEAGYPIEADLASARTRCTNHGAIVLVAKFLDDPELLAAADWLDSFGKRVGYNYDQVIAAGREFVLTGDTYVQGYNWAAVNEMQEDGVRDAYWNAMRLVTGIVPNEPTDPYDYDNDTNNPFDCPC